MPVKYATYIHWALLTRRGGGGGPKNHTVFRSNVCNSNIFMTKKDRCWILLQEYTKTQLRPSVGFRKLLRIDWLNAVGVARIFGGGRGWKPRITPEGEGGSTAGARTTQAQPRHKVLQMGHVPRMPPPWLGRQSLCRKTNSWCLRRSLSRSSRALKSKYFW